MKTDLKKLFADSYAVIWDMDGVLVDSESYHFEAHKKALAEENISLTKEYYIHHGVSIDPQIFYRELFSEHKLLLDDAKFLNIHYRKLAIYQQLQREKGIKIITPAYEIVKKLFQKGVLMAISSTVDRDEVLRSLRNSGLLEYFPIIVAGGDFNLRRKPEPDIYLKCLSILNTKANSTLAIEDSTNGAKSAVRAGIPCLVVTNEYTHDHTFPKEAIITSFAAIADAIL